LTHPLKSFGSICDGLVVGYAQFIISRPFNELFPEQLAINKIEMLPIKLEHLAALAQLPLHHRDPFDRMIIAQAIAENLQIISKDRVFHKYPIQLIW